MAVSVFEEKNMSPGADLMVEGVEKEGASIWRRMNRSAPCWPFLTNRFLEPRTGVPVRAKRNRADGASRLCKKFPAEL